MDDGQQFAIDDDVIQSECYSDSDGIAEERDNVLYNPDGHSRLGTLIGIYKVNALNKQRQLKYNIEHNYQARSQCPEYEHRECAWSGDGCWLKILYSESFFTAFCFHAAFFNHNVLLFQISLVLENPIYFLHFGSNLSAPINTDEHKTNLLRKPLMESES